MREDVTACVDALDGVPEAKRRTLAKIPASRAMHDEASGHIAALNAVELFQPPGLPAPNGLAPAHSLRVAAWNAERLKYHDASRRLLEVVDAEIVLLTEVDIGMARSGNVHIVRRSAPEGYGWALGIEFVELRLGDTREQVWHADETNIGGLHGNAILSRLPINEPRIVPLDEGGVWFTKEMKQGQRRVGARMGALAEIAGIWLASVHLESESDPGLRAGQIARLLDGLNRAAGDAPAIIGGDLNTNALPLGVPVCFTRLSETEPLFDRLAEAGFTWHEANTGEPTQRARPDGTPSAPFRRLDWLVTRGLAASAARPVPATVDETGQAISDHDLVVADVGRA